MRSASRHAQRPHGIVGRVLWMILATSAAHCSAQTPGEYETMREKMVEQQLKTRDITDPRVLRAMADVPRHQFVPEPARPSAYRDGPLPIGEEQTISQPYMVAIMTQCLELEGTEKVLEIGTGSGYQAAVLGELADKVYTIEIVEPLGKRADSTLMALGYENVHVKIGDGFHGWKEHAPYDRVMITCAVETVPEPLVRQLALGGKMVLPIGETRAHQKLKVLSKKPDGSLSEEYVLDCVFVPMTGDHGFEQ